MSQMSLRQAFLVYTGGRIALFLLVALIVYSAGGLVGDEVNGLPLLLISLLGSALLGVVLLRAQRDRFALALAEQRETKAQEIAARRARLDDGPAA